MYYTTDRLFRLAEKWDDRLSINIVHEALPIFKRIADARTFCIVRGCRIVKIFVRKGRIVRAEVVK